MQVRRAGDRQALDQIKLPQTKHEPPPGEGNREDNPNRDQRDSERSAFAFSAHV